MTIVVHQPKGTPRPQPLSSPHRSRGFRIWNAAILQACDTLPAAAALPPSSSVRPCPAASRGLAGRMPWRQMMAGVRPLPVLDWGCLSPPRRCHGDARQTRTACFCNVAQELSIGNLQTTKSVLNVCIRVKMMRNRIRLYRCMVKHAKSQKPCPDGKMGASEV
jgi:hypothetical protein